MRVHGGTTVLMGHRWSTSVNIGSNRFFLFPSPPQMSRLLDLLSHSCFSVCFKFSVGRRKVKLHSEALGLDRPGLAS